MVLERLIGMVDKLLIEYMVKQGYDVYLLDWDVPGPEDKDLKFDDYVLDYLTRAVRKLKAVSGSDELSMLGWCIGAILAPIYAALRPDDGLKNLILLTAPLDFSDKTAGGYVRWVNDQHFDPIRSSTPSVSYMVVRMEARKQHQKVAVVHGAWYKEKYVLREGEWGKHEKRIN
jgi:poly(3-hydroxyalkanoate) synthetase